MNNIAEQTAPEARQFEKVCAIIDNYGRSESKLIPILQAVQEEYRYLPEELLTFIAITLDIPPARVFGVATFYSHFALKPKGKYIIKVCDGTACHVKNSVPIIEAIQKKYKLTEKDNTTKDMLFTLETVSCLGACGIAPVVVINEDVYSVMTPDKTLNELHKIESQEALDDRRN